MSNNERTVCLDTETTGFNHATGDRIVEIGAVELIGNLESGRNFHVYLDPYPQKVDPGAFEVHQLSNEFLSKQPKFRDEVDKFLEFIGDAPLIIHNARFDMGFLNMELTRAKREPLGNEIRDTLRIARLKYPGQRATLDALCSRLDIDNSVRELHGALTDAKLLAQVYVKMQELDRLAFHSEEAEQKVIEIAAFLGIKRCPRIARDILLPSEMEFAAHESFINTGLKDSLWGKMA